MALLTIDGDQGEGGGQILRTALALSLCLQRPFRISNIRRRRSKPGLRPQHLVAVAAAAEIAGAEVRGQQAGSSELVFIPGPTRAGDYHFAIGSAGSTTLVLQTVLPALMMLPQPSRLLLEGGTHNPLAPPFDFLQQVFLPLLMRMGVRVEARLLRAGFYPAGGGALEVLVTPTPRLAPFDLLQRGRLLGIDAVALLAKLPEHIARRELAVLRTVLRLKAGQTRLSRPASAGPGNALLVTVRSEQITELFSSFGRRGIKAETVATELAEQVLRYLEAEVPVGPHLADQLLLPLALAGGGRFMTLAPELHTTTNMAVIRQFMEIGIRCEQQGEDRWLIDVGAAP